MSGEEVRVPLLDPLNDDTKQATANSKTSNAMTIANLVKAYLGSGLLVIPYGARCGGMWLSFVGVVLLSLMSNHTLKMVIRIKRAVIQRNHKNITYDRLGLIAYGKWGHRLTLFAMTMTNLGIAIGYMIFVGQTLDKVATISGAKASVVEPLFFGHTTVSVFLCAAAPFFIGLSLLRSMKRLSATSVVGNIAIAIAIIAVLYSGVKEISENGFADVPAARIETFPTFFGIMVFSFAIHGIILPMEEAMEHPESAERVCDIGVAIVIVVYSSFSLLGYAAWGDSVAASVLDSLSEVTTVDKVIKISTGVLLSIAILLTIPLYFFGVFQVVDPTVRADADNEDNEDNIQSSAKGGAGSMGKSTCIRVITVLISMLVAILLGPLFSEVVSFVGAFSMSLVVFILPSCFYLKLVPSRGKMDRCVAWGLLVFGVCAMSLATWESIDQIVFYFVHNREKMCGE